MMQFPLRIELRRSRRLALLIVLLHLLAAGCVGVLPWPVAARCLLVGIIGVSAWQALRPSGIIGLRLDERGELALVRPTGEPLFVSVLADSSVFTQLVVLRVRDEEDGRRRSLVLLPDSMPAEEFRLLRLWLRWLTEPRDQAAGGV